MLRFIFLSLILLSIKLNAQETLLHCGTDEMRQQLFDNHPELHSGIINANQKLQDFTQQYISQNANSRGGQVYIIPVVFHVIHNFGAENISDEQIYDAVRVLNLNYRKQNADTVDIVNDFKPIAADCQIELRIARKDPDGNCTKGINRIASPLSLIGDHQVKDLIHWDPSKYLNVYVCTEAAGLAGHALLPADADTVPEWDGIVIQHSYLGSIGTSNQLRSVVLSHELGHYLNLQHIWGGNNVPGFYYLPVGQQDNCNYDDDVQDTPNTIGWSTCNLNANSCDSLLDNVQNFMDYAYCARMFTEGQKQRMHACLNSTVANRNNLWQSTNLAATGVDGSVSICEADFVADKTVICEGQTVTFTDKSYHDVTGREWTFAGGNISPVYDSTTVSITYNTPGIYDVALTAASGNNFTGTRTKSNYITVLSKNEFTAPFWESFEYDSSLLNNFWFVENNYNDAGFQITDAVAYTFTSSLMLENFSDTIDRNIDEITSRTFDLSSYDSVGSISLTFKYAFASKTGLPLDRLKFFISSDCGETWIQKANLTGTALATAAATNLPFYPQSTSEWKQFDVSGISGALLTDGFRIKFSFESRGGNNLFIDDINFGNTNIAFSSVINNFLKQNNLSAYPNPFQNEVVLSFQNSDNEYYTANVSDLTGRIMIQQKGKVNNAKVILDLPELNQGIYFIRIETNDIVKTVKVLKH
jgi:PKD repeat protein